MQLKDIAPSTSTLPSITPINLDSDSAGSAPPVESSHPDIQELLARFHTGQDLDCPSLDRGDRDFIGAIYMEVVHNPDFHPTPEILALIRAVNARMMLGTSRVVS